MARKVFKHVGNGILAITIVVLASLLFTFVSSGFHFNRANVFGYRVIAVVSESMEPTIMTNALAINKVFGNEYEVGDIVVYEHSDNNSGFKYNIIHRIIEITDEGIITKGDNNPEKDAWVTPKEDILGKIVSIGNWAAPIMSFIRN